MELHFLFTRDLLFSWLISAIIAIHFISQVLNFCSCFENESSYARNCQETHLQNNKYIWETTLWQTWLPWHLSVFMEAARDKEFLFSSAIFFFIVAKWIKAGARVHLKIPKPLPVSPWILYDSLKPIISTCWVLHQKGISKFSFA